MDAAERQGIVERLRAEILLPRTDAFLMVAEGLREEPIEAFQEAATHFIQQARALFRELIEVPTAFKVPPELNQLFYAYMVSDFNSALPNDYPYILAMANIRGERRYCVVCIARKWVVERFPEAPATAVSIISVETSEDLARGQIDQMDIAYNPADLRIVPID